MKYGWMPEWTMPTYRHDTDELAWSSEGTASIIVAGSPWTVSPEQAVWIPAGVSHKVPSTRKAILFPLHFDTSAPGPAWIDPTSLWVGPELRSQLMRYIQSTFGEGGQTERERDTLLAMLPAHRQSEAFIPIPSDPRANYVAQRLMENPSDQRGIEDWAGKVGTSGKTLQRAFIASTGMNFAEWRLRARLSASLHMLAQGMPIGEIAERVGYSSASGFTTAFRRHFGHAPSEHGHHDRAEARAESRS
ncbi:MAG: AraC family transcriptional regulator [Leucobacter sp.]